MTQLDFRAYTSKPLWLDKQHYSQTETEVLLYFGSLCFCFSLYGCCVTVTIARACLSRVNNVSFHFPSPVWVLEDTGTTNLWLQWCIVLTNITLQTIPQVTLSYSLHLASMQQLKVLKQMRISFSSGTLQLVKTSVLKKTVFSQMELS